MEFSIYKQTFLNLYYLIHLLSLRINCHIYYVINRFSCCRDYALFVLRFASHKGDEGHNVPLQARDYIFAFR